MKPTEEEVSFPPVDKAAAEALRPVLRSRQPSKFRLLQVVCERQHRLLDVYATAAGPVYTNWETFGAVTGRTLYRGRPVVRFLRALPSQSMLWLDESSAACRCRDATVDLGWVAARLAEGRKRVVWPVARNRA